MPATSLSGDCIARRLPASAPAHPRSPAPRNRRRPQHLAQMEVAVNAGLLQHHIGFFRRRKASSTCRRRASSRPTSSTRSSAAWPAATSIRRARRWRARGTDGPTDSGRFLSSRWGWKRDSRSGPPGPGASRRCVGPRGHRFEIQAHAGDGQFGKRSSESSKIGRRLASMTAAGAGSTVWAS